LFKDKEKIKKMTSEYKSISWRRPHQIHKEAVFCLGDKSRCDMKFGAMSDGVFTGALATIAIHPAIDKLMTDVESLKYGYAAF
jgi:Calpain family cysteine protease